MKMKYYINQFKNNAFFNYIGNLLFSNMIEIDSFKADRFYYYFTTFLTSCVTSVIIAASICLKTNEFEGLLFLVLFIGLAFTMMIGLIPMLLTANILTRIDKLNVQGEKIVKGSSTAKGKMFTIQLIVVLVLMLFTNHYIHNLYDLANWWEFNF